MWSDVLDLWESLGALRSLAIVQILVGVPVAVVLLCGGLGALVIGPLRRRAERLRAPRQFQLSDVFWLLVQFQIALAYAVRQVGVEQLAYFSLVFGFLVLATLGMWTGAVSFMSRAGVAQPMRRAAFILVQLPATLALMIVAAYVVVVMPASLALDRLVPHGSLALYLGTSEFLRRGNAFLAGVAVAFVAAAYLLRQLAFWILREPVGDASSDASPFDVLGGAGAKCGTHHAK